MHGSNSLRRLRGVVRETSARVRASERTPQGLIVVGALTALAVIWVALGPFSSLLGGETVSSLRGKERADAIDDVRRTVLTAIGGGAALVAIAFTARTFYLSRRGQETDRFSRAVTQLASERLEERLGGIHALEQVMRESPRDHEAVIAILCAFVRRKTAIPPAARHRPGTVPDHGPSDRGEEPDLDVDAAMTCLARRPTRPEPNRPDLRHTSMQNLSIRAYDFANPPRLTRMFLTAADLRHADFRGACLVGSILNGADLQHAWLSDADLRHVALGHANLRFANLSGTQLDGAMLDGADLRDVDGLTAAQLAVTFISRDTRLPSLLAANPWVIQRLLECDVPDDDRTAWFCPPPTPPPAHASS